LVVSIETVAPAAARRSITGSTRRSSSSTGTSPAPGRVDSPPTSSRSAPSSTILSACATAAPVSACAPPSENESGVTLSTPMMNVRSPSFSSRVFSFQTNGLRIRFSG